MMVIYPVFEKFARKIMFFGLGMKFKLVSVVLESKNFTYHHSISMKNSSRLLAADHENVRPDVLILGKALAGGFYPVRMHLPTLSSN
jgi:hypothetical protein